MQTYPQIYNLGHSAVQNIFSYDVLVEEKIDGSQMSFGLFEGKLYARSKRQPIDVDNPPGLFAGATATAVRLAAEGRLQEGWTYRGESIQSPRHNKMKYNRTPIGNFIVFDIEGEGEQNFLTRDDKEFVTRGLGLEIVPVLLNGRLTGREHLDSLLARDSVLGGGSIEGVVMKAYGYYGLDKKTLMAKWVTPEFREKMGLNPKISTRHDYVQQLAAFYNTEARWDKALIHLREEGVIIDAPQDIGKLIQEVPADIIKEHEDEIKENLWKHFLPELRKVWGRGLAEWYKAKLLEKQFGEEE